MIPSPSPVVHHDPEDLLQQDGNRVAEYTRWRAFARGIQWEERPGYPAPPRRMTFNYARALLRKTASYVFPQPVAFSIVTDHKDPTTTHPAERVLAQLVADLDLASLDLELEIERSTIGDAAVKVTWDTAAKRPRVVSVDPATLSAEWSPDNPREPRAITQTYTLPGWALLPYGIDVKNDQQLQTVTETWTLETWTITVSGTDLHRQEKNPYGWIPYLVIPNDPHPRRFWGRSDLLDLQDVTVEFNRELSVLSQIMEISGAPIAVLENVDGSDGITTRPGAKWELPADSRAYLLDLLQGQGVRLHTDYLDQLRTTMHDLSETPRTAFGDTGRALSGAALEVEIQPLVQRVWRKRNTWNRFYRERNRRLLDLAALYGTTPIGPERTTEAIWPSVLPSDDDANVRNQVQLVGAGIRSRYSAGVALGDADPEHELDRIIAEGKRLAVTTPPDDDDASDESGDEDESLTGPNNAPSSDDDEEEDDQ